MDGSFGVFYNWSSHLPALAMPYTEIHVTGAEVVGKDVFAYMHTCYVWDDG